MSQIAQLRGTNIGTGFRAFALRGGGTDDAIDPFLGVDHAKMSEPTFAAHPHAGFSAVSYLFADSETGINNRDSLGTRNLIQPGGLHWTAAGRGVVHDEVPAAPGKTVHMLQIFVNLPVDRQQDAPFTLSLEPQDVPLVQPPGANIRVPLGSFGQVHSPLSPPTEVNLIDITLEEGAELLLPVAAGHGAFILPVFGTVEIDGQLFDANEPRLPLFPVQGTARDIELKATQGSAQVVLFGGKPLRQPVFWQGPMAMASMDALTERIAAYQRGEFGTV
jgi:redox-sensitive bicupin YhaK (pirin superfamily)